MFLFTSRATSAQQPSVADSVPHAAPLRQASQATGVSFDYLAKTAERESRFNPTAKAPTSSATGMFQFLEQTWLGMVKQEGAKLGLTNEAAAISGDGGRFSVPDTGMRQKILALREDPGISAMMAGAFASRNGKQLEEAIGRKPSEGELYIAHFLGASGARDLINLAKSNPDATAASSFRDAAAANKSVFYDRTGRARSASEVYGNLTAAFSANPVLQNQQTAATTDKAYQMFRVKEGGKPMHGLFRSSGEPVASAVADTWGKMARRSPDQAAETRVAFFPRDTRIPGAVVSDASPAAVLPAVSGERRAVNIPLPQQRPAALQGAAEAVQPQAAARKRSSARVGQPLDLMRFVKTGPSS
jgi:Transglycosylase SLT domain